MLEQETDYLMPPKDILFEPSTIETIDTALYEWVDKRLDLSTMTNTGMKKVPVLWLGAERSFQIKNKKELRDAAGKLILPLMSVNRVGMTKDLNFKGSFQAFSPENPDYRGGAITIYKRIKQDKTRNFNNADKKRMLKGGDETGRLSNPKVVYQEITIPAPVYVTVNYDVVLRTEYQQQMNDLLQPFATSIGQLNSFLISKDNYKYEAFIEQDFASNKNAKSFGEDERMFETTIKIKVLGFLIGEGNNRAKPKVSIRENRVQVRISNERVVVGEDRPWSQDDFDYRD